MLKVFHFVIIHVMYFQLESWTKKRTLLGLLHVRVEITLWNIFLIKIVLKKYKREQEP